MTLRRRWLRPTIPAVVLAAVAGAPASGDELWRGSAANAECRLELVNELGGVRITSSAVAGSSAVIRGPSELRIEASAAAGRAALSVAWSGSPVDDAGDVEVSVPPECGLAVRTAAGGVSLDVGRQAFPVAVDTSTGDITAWIDPDTDAAIAFATSGEITTDFDVEIDLRYHAEPAKHGRVRLRGGAPGEDGSKEVFLHTRRGTVRLLRASPPRPSTERPSTERSSTERSSPDRPSTERPSTERSGPAHRPRRPEPTDATREQR